MKFLQFPELLEIAVAEGATTPVPTAGKTIAWSTTLGMPVVWDSTKWNSLPIGEIGSAALTNSTLAAETVLAKWSVPANFLKNGDELAGNFIGQVSSTATLTFRIRIGTTGTTSDAVLGLFTTSAAGVANQHLFMDFLVSMLSATTATAGGRAGFGGAAFGIATAAFAAAAVNLTVANFISITLVQSVAQTFTSRAASLQRAGN